MQEPDRGGPSQSPRLRRLNAAAFYMPRYCRGMSQMIRLDVDMELTLLVWQRSRRYQHRDAATKLPVSGVGLEPTSSGVYETLCYSNGDPGRFQVMGRA